MTTATNAPNGPERFAAWPPELAAEVETHTANPRVGTRLLHADDRSRLWEIRLASGERLAFHRHVLDYVWTCVSGGEAISHHADGGTHRVRYGVGETRALAFERDESMLHDIENTGSDDLVFTTIEFLASANPPLPLDASTLAAAP